jgi:hypothetical protein
LQVKLQHPGIFFRLESNDFKYGATKEFLAAVKKLGASYEPVEMPIDEHWWYLPLSQKAKFEELKYKLIDLPIQSELSLRKSGYRPIPGKSKFARKQIV